MHHVDVTPSAADVARPLAPSDVTVALETRAGCVRATTAVLAALVTSATRSPQPPPPRRAPTLVLPAVQAEPATRSASTPTTGPRESTTAPTLSTPHPRHRAAGRQRADHHSSTGHGPSPGHRR